VLFYPLQFYDYFVAAVKTTYFDSLLTRWIRAAHLQHLNRRENIMIEKTAKSGGIAAADFKRITGFVSGLTYPLTDFTVAITLYPSGVGNAILVFSLQLVS